MFTKKRFDPRQHLRTREAQRTQRHFSRADTAAADAMACQLEERGYSFKEIKERVEAKYGVGAIRYEPHDRKNGGAAARRRRQMQRGQIAANAVLCQCGKPLPPGRAAGMLCDVCLAAKWG